MNAYHFVFAEEYTEKELIHNQDKCVVITADLDGFPVVLLKDMLRRFPMNKF